MRRAPRTPRVGAAALLAFGLTFGLPGAHARAQAPAPAPCFPIGRVVQEGELGDDLVSEGGGDPYFLGFAAGAYAPPRGERLDPELARANESLDLAAHPARKTYAFVMLAGRIRDDPVQALAHFGEIGLQGGGAYPELYAGTSPGGPVCPELRHSEIDA